ncbi:DUF2505 domain-containing protein [Mycobacterium sp. CBMA247]|nr:DUF2505 domain-containing protein [Mycolicibacterium sp. CBMA 329]MUL89957.1 DUF2505 domain-containing protein [Mycolicibacterium sp. CBMA 331]MUL98022.1 DUF2505 domain-containing protein [Mycolicibacterium sp. CBMA 334]MUM27541.1 DUF2505 domain-containing protein [Mycolicibacterium sp. CBMA 295]MUM39472.1 DUF2505 domain-containing protein [Mycolicibacterium sp. CBMA 247]MUM46558.1 DUF2505 domain-containing protein [Mycolicibacterium sp. CBMA 294]
MPRSFNFSLDSSSGVEQILAAFGERDYWLARLSAFSGIDTLERLSVDPDGSVTAVIVKDVHRNGEPSPIARFFPQDWRVVQQEQWHPVGERRVSGEVSIVPNGAPGSAAGTALLTPTRNGSRLKCTATVEFTVPLIGGRIENLMGRVLVQNITALQAFTTEWINTHG